MANRDRFPPPPPPPPPPRLFDRRSAGMFDDEWGDCPPHLLSLRFLADSIDVKMGPELAKQRPYCPAETQDSEDPLFLLYTSGAVRAGRAAPWAKALLLCLPPLHTGPCGCAPDAGIPPRARSQGPRGSPRASCTPAAGTSPTQRFPTGWCSTTAPGTCLRAWRTWAGLRATHTSCACPFAWQPALPPPPPRDPLAASRCGRGG